MKKLKAFTFVELLLVMLVLGIIISLTLPIVKNIKDDGDIYRAYMKKANQDVTDAINMIFIKEPVFTGFHMFEDNPGSLTKFYNAAGDAANDPNKTKWLRNAFNTGLNTQECKDCKDSANKSTCSTDGNCTAIDFQNAAGVAQGVTAKPGLVLNGKPIWLFSYGVDNNYGGTGETIYGRIYVDMNKEKAPNTLCKDRYIFVIYNDRVAMEGCDYSL